MDEPEPDGMMVADDVMPGGKSGNPAGNDRGKVAESESREVESGGAMLGACEKEERRDSEDEDEEEADGVECARNAAGRGCSGWRGCKA